MNNLLNELNSLKSNLDNLPIMNWCFLMGVTLICSKVPTSFLVQYSLKTKTKTAS